jgi:nitrogen-specific signal transduction histidine kinase
MARLFAPLISTRGGDPGLSLTKLRDSQTLVISHAKVVEESSKGLPTQVEKLAQGLVKAL